jgi:putative ATPase
MEVAELEHTDNMNKYIPLAKILRPKTLSDVIGQQHLIGPGAPLRKLIERNKLKSIILFGPPGLGKTTLMEVIARTTKSKCISLNATSLTIKDLRREGNIAKESNTNVVITLDEIYRLTRPQSDALLPFVEDGDIIFIGCSSENPYHTVSSPLISRSQIFELEPLKPIDIIKIIQKAIQYYHSNNKNITIEPEATKYITKMCCGDARKALTILEMAVEITDKDKITLECVKIACPSKYPIFSADNHFDYASALQGSLQHSDPDAAVYWLAKWLEAGEDPRYVARRLVIAASEDCCSTPEAAIIAHSAYIAAKEIGRPECDIVMAHAVVAIATAKRDKAAAMAIWGALKDVREGANIEVPKEMKDGHYEGAAKLGNGAYKDGMNQEAYIGINKVYFKPW